MRMNETVFLPDRDGRDTLSEQTGFVRFGADRSALRELAERLAVPERAEGESEADDRMWRGVLALALLCDVWAEGNAKLSVVHVNAETSSFAAWVLAALPAGERDGRLSLLLLEKGTERTLLGIADAREGIRLPASPSDLSKAAPEDAAWIDRENGCVSDPVPFLNERERLILLGRMELLKLHTNRAAAFMQALRQADQAEVEAVRAGEEEALERLAVRMEAVHGLSDFEAFSKETKRLGAPGGNPLMACFTGEDVHLRSDPDADTVYLWNGVPFACTSSELGLTGVRHPEMDAALGQITQELALMSVSSVRWNHRTAMALQGWLDAHGKSDLLLPQARERIAASCRLMAENGRQVQTAVTLVWPWDAESGAVKAILMEALGTAWMRGAASPFADRLTKLTGHVLGDTVLQSCCACADGVLLPPLSREMAACVARAEAGGGLALDTLRFQPQADGGITVSFLLRGAGEVHMTRSYGAEEILVLGEQASPCVAVWPCLPMAPWRAYHVFSRGGAEVAALCGGEWQSIPLAEGAEAAPWRCLHTAEFPSCLSLTLDGLCLGALPNLLPVFRCEQAVDVTAAIDLGSNQTVVAFGINGEARTLEGRELTRMLVMPQEMAEDDFLASLTPESVTHTAVAITGPGEVLFTDGYAYRPTGMAGLARRDAHTLRTTLKWRADGESVRAKRLLLHQVMQGAALTALLNGARSIAWRVSIADEMGDEGRNDMLRIAEELSLAVAEETGLPLSHGVPAVTWAEESAALCAGLRGEGIGRGSYVALDLGGGSTKMHLWVQGQPRPVAGAVLLEGVQSMLLHALCLKPQRLLEDFADCEDEALLQAILAITGEMNPDLACPRQTDKLGLMLDTLLDTLRPNVVRHLNARFNAQNPTYMQSVLLETEAALLFIAGLMMAQAGENTMLNHLLPQDITVCFSGRGAWLLETLTPAMRNSLQHLTHVPMRLDHPVRFVTLRASARPEQSVALGLAVTRDVQRLSEAPLVRTRESFSALMRQLMVQLVAAFPMHMWQLHEDLFDVQGALTIAGEDSIRRAASRCYGDGEDIPAAVMAFVRELRDHPILPDAMVRQDA